MRQKLSMEFILVKTPACSDTAQHQSNLKSRDIQCINLCHKYSAEEVFHFIYLNWLTFCSQASYMF